MRLTFAILLLVVAGRLIAGEAAPPDPLSLLPPLPKPKAVAIVPPAGLKEIAPGVSCGDGVVVLDGHVIMDEGPVDGLEVLACMQAGKTHESTVLLDSGNGVIIKAAFMLLGFDQEGVPPPMNGGQPARGTPVRVQAIWQSGDDPGKWLGIDASSLVRDRVIDRPYPPLPFIYTGSRMVPIRQNGADGKPVEVETFMLDSTKSVIVNYDEPDALIASPFPGAGWNTHRFEVNSGVCPPPKTFMRLVFTRATLPLTIDLAADGALSFAGKALADDALAALLAERYSDQAAPAFRAVAVRVAASVDRARDLETRSRLLAAAANGKVWVVPVFVLAP